MLRKALTIAKYVSLGLIAATAVIFVFGFFVMWLWNWLMPDIFGLPAITYWQAWGLLLLGHLLFGGAGHESRHEHRHSGVGGQDGGFKTRVKEAFTRENGQGTAPAEGPAPA